MMQHCAILVKLKSSERKVYFIRRILHKVDTRESSQGIQNERKETKIKKMLENS